jgi:hypothetical protein
VLGEEAHREVVRRLDGESDQREEGDQPVSSHP